MLIAFDEPIGFPMGHRLVVSLDLPNGHFHALGAIVRMQRGDDFHTYAAIQFLNVHPDDFAELSRQLDELDQADGRGSFHPIES